MLIPTPVPKTVLEKHTKVHLKSFINGALLFTDFRHPTHISLLCHCPTLVKTIEGCMGGEEQFWPAPEGNPCSIFFWVWTSFFYGWGGTAEAILSLPGNTFEDH